MAERSRGGPAADLTASRSDTRGQFGAAKRVFPGGATSEYDVALLGDGAEILFSSRSPGDGGLEFNINTASRNADQSGYSESVPVNGLNTGVDDDQPYALPNGEAVYFASRRDGASKRGSHLWVARREGATFGHPTLLASLVSDHGEQYPVVTADELTIFYSKLDDDAAIQARLWTASRANNQAAFTDAKPVDALTRDGVAVTLPSYVTADQCEMFLTYGGVAEGFDLYHAYRIGTRVP